MWEQWGAGDAVRCETKGCSTLLLLLHHKLLDTFWMERVATDKCVISSLESQIKDVCDLAFRAHSSTVHATPSSFFFEGLFFELVMLEAGDRLLR